MKAAFEIPDDIAAALSADGRDLSRVALEALALEGYRTERLSESQVRRMLGFSVRMQVHQFMKDHDVPLNYSYEDFLHDYETASRVADEIAKGRNDIVPERRAG